jgi:hypothetical protein
MAGSATDGGRAAAVSRRTFLSSGAAGAVALTGAGATGAAAQADPPVKWDRSADVVIIGAGVSGLAAAIAARDVGASVISVERNFDIGGRGILSGGRVHLGGGHALQQKAGLKDSADQVFTDWVRFDTLDARYSDRDLVRVFADENLPTFNFLVENGVKFIEKPIGPERASTLPRTFLTVEWPIKSELIAPGRGRNGSGLVRQLAVAARRKGGEILLKHQMKSIIRDRAGTGKVLGIAVVNNGATMNIEARKGVIIATGGHTGNVNFRRMFDPRLTEEYQQACEPYMCIRVRTASSPPWRSGPRYGRPRTRPPRPAPRSPRRAISAAGGAMRRWCSSPTARSSIWRAPPVSRSKTGRTSSS